MKMEFRKNSLNQTKMGATQSQPASYKTKCNKRVALKLIL
ncbi:hypothetical protein HMPREF3034_01464 [Prevotella sp. DNF00663]|nr:hypothetical protein HMPREF3034_01464 [Prevotella sp. DNF00663]